MASKPITGILKALDEELGIDILRSTAKSVPKGVTITARPKFERPPEPTNVHPDLLRGMELHPDWLKGLDPATIEALLDPSAMKGGSFSTGVSLNTYPPVERMFHATNRRMPYDQPVGDISDVGLHLSPSSNVTDFYALTQDTKDIDLLEKAQQGNLPSGLSLAGPRTYPLLVDPGRKFKDFPVDAGHWNSPHDVAFQARIAQIGDFDPDLDKILKDMESGKKVSTAFRDMGYDSIMYPHMNMYHPRGAQVDALMLFDPSRAVPEYSTLGGEIKKTRGVLHQPPPYDRPYEDDAILSSIETDAESLDEAIGHIFDPRARNLSDNLRALKWEYEEVADTDDAKGWIMTQMNQKMKELSDLNPKLASFMASNMPNEIATQWGSK